jgi:natural product precursor
MKKESKPKKVRKLSLNRETVRQLSAPDMSAVVGGVTATFCSSRCTAFDSCDC